MKSIPDIFPAFLKTPVIKSLALWLFGALLFAAAYRVWQWQGVALLASGLVFWALLHVTRLLQALKRAANRPIGYIGSAVMLNAKLKPGVSMLHVVALTKSLGAQLSPKDTQPEQFRWTDAGDSHVTCTFAQGKLVQWQLERPAPTENG
jgi:hypothetical protein